MTGGDPWAWPVGTARHVLPQVDSTNAEAARLAPALSGPAWILALRQTAGRARRGRVWIDPPGNFAATLVMRPEGSALAAAQRSFTAALALADALQTALGPRGQIALKWPNDVLLNGGKVSGILLEGLGQGPQHSVAQLAIGIGVNLAHAPDPAGLDPVTAPPVSVQGETGLVLTPEELLDLLAPAFARWEARHRAEGFAPIRDAWLARAARLGDVITARSLQETITGRFETVDDQGALVLATDHGRRVIPAADIYFQPG